ncbi:MAG: bacteriohemerythrin [Ignavibacteria bacterium]
MHPINWSQKYSVGVNEIDTQHKQLIDYINELDNAMKAGQARESLNSIIQNLINYTKTHFALEEKYFDQFPLPGNIKHKKEHEMFISTIMDFQTRFILGNSSASIETINSLRSQRKRPLLALPSSISIEIINFLRNWFVHHICISDKKNYLVLN